MIMVSSYYLDKMKDSVYLKLQSLGFTGSQYTPNSEVIHWLNESNILRIEPYWRFLGSSPGFSWSKSWDEYSDKYEVECETWEELLEIALEQSVSEAL